MKIITGCKIIISIVLYITLSVLTFGAANADLQYDCHNTYRNICDSRKVAKDRAFAILFASNPGGWIVVMFVTGFYYNGISFSATPVFSTNSMS